MPTAGKAPGSGSSFTGREPHAIPGVTLPFAVILTAHRLQLPLHPARQTSAGFGWMGHKPNPYWIDIPIGILLLDLSRFRLADSG